MLQDKIKELIKQYGKDVVIKKLHISKTTLNKILSGQKLPVPTNYRVCKQLENLNIHVTHQSSTNEDLMNDIDRLNKQKFIDYFNTIYIQKIKEHYKQDIDAFIRKLAIKQLKQDLNRINVCYLLKESKIIYANDINILNEKYGIDLQQRQKCTHEQDVKHYLKNNKQSKSNRVRTKIPSLNNDGSVLQFSQKFGFFIKHLRELSNLTLTDFAKKFGTNVTHLWKMEKGLSVYIPLKFMKNLKQYFGKDISKIFKESIDV